MRMRALGLLVVPASAFFGTQRLIAQQSDTDICKAPLIRSEVRWQYDQSLRLSILTLVDREMFNTNRRSIAGGMDLPVDNIPLSAFATYEKFDEARSREVSKLKFDYDLNEAQSYLASHVPDAAFRAFSECIRDTALRGYGLHLITKEISQDYVSVDVFWNPPPGVGAVDVSTFSVSGNAAPVKDIPQRLEPNSFVPVDVARSSEEPFRLTVAAGGYPPARLSVPLPIQAPPEFRHPWELSGFRPRLDIVVHVQGIGDVSGRENRWIGTRGQSRRIEGFQFNLVDSIPGLTVEYLCHVQGAGRGDTPYMTSGSYCGTRGEGRRMEGFAIRLKGPLAAQYRVVYSCHVQGFGDMSSNAEDGYCGTRGQQRRVEAILVYIERL